MSTPNCLACIHCDLDSGWGGTDITPGEPMSFACRKGKWDADGEMHADNRKVIFAAARDCKEFSPEPWAKEQA